jgi:hypothetical protein
VLTQAEIDQRAFDLYESTVAWERTMAFFKKRLA